MDQHAYSFTLLIIMTLIIIAWQISKLCGALNFLYFCRCSHILGISPFLMEVQAMLLCRMQPVFSSIYLILLFKMCNIFCTVLANYSFMLINYKPSRPETRDSKRNNLIGKNMFSYHKWQRSQLPCRHYQAQKF